MRDDSVVYEFKSDDAEFVKYYLWGNYEIDKILNTDNPNTVRFITSKKIGREIMADEVVRCCIIPE